MPKGMKKACRGQINLTFFCEHCDYVRIASSQNHLKMIQKTHTKLANCKPSNVGTIDTRISMF